VRIVPFRGEYYELKNSSAHLVRHLIYPVPDPRFPFLGVHFTRMIRGGIEAGPNAVLAFKREGYTRWSFSLRDTLANVCYGGFWLMAAAYWRMGLGEFCRSFSKRAFVKALQRLVPEIGLDDVAPGGAGVRAQALAPDGKLLDDFRIEGTDRMIHVLNAPSPAATASISIGRTIASMAVRNFDLSR
jgi:L-2-hydroxyglutarate oxidase